MSTSDRSDNDRGATSVTQFASDLALLVRQELEAARAELAEKAKAAGIGAGMLSASAIGAIFTLGSLTVLIVVGLALALPLWLAVLIATALWGGVTATLALLGKKKVEEATPFVPEQTIAEVKEDVQWARRGVKLPLK